MNILTIDIGGTNIKLLATGQTEPRKIPSGPELTPQTLVQLVPTAVADWPHEAISIGYPGFVFEGSPVCDPANLGSGWVGYDFKAGFGKPVKLLNDAAMQALGSYEKGRMLFLGLGTGLGSAIIIDGELVPLEVAHLPYRKGKTFEDYLGLRGLERMGEKKWIKHLFAVVDQLRAAFRATEVVIGGGNVKRVEELPPGCRRGSNTHAFTGGFRLWEQE